MDTDLRAFGLQESGDKAHISPASPMAWVTQSDAADRHVEAFSYSVPLAARIGTSIGAMRHPLLLALLAAAATTSMATAPDKLAQDAGPQPTETQAREAVIEQLKHTVKDASDFRRVRFLSGPHLASGVNFAGGREQGWLMCVITGNGRMSSGPLDLEVKPYLLRARGNRLVAVSPADWKDSDIKC